MITSAAIDLLSDLPVVDDIDAEWPKQIILIGLCFPPSVKNALCNHHWNDRNAVSLGEIFELVISDDADPRPGYIVSPLLDIRTAGKKNTIGVIERIATIDCGRRCNLAWAAKYKKFRASHRMKGSGDLSWSFPLTEEGKKAARYKTGGLHRP